MNGSPVATGTVLDRIVNQTARDLEIRMERVPRSELQRELASAPSAVDVVTALRQDTVSIIAEFKRASPSRGTFPVEADPADVAAGYVAGGASMVSCLTDKPFFQGTLEDLDAVVATTNANSRPVGVLRKDFMIDDYQIDEARVHGASCILLIAACLTTEQMVSMTAYSKSLGMAALVEVHNEAELERALRSGSQLFGINNRDLATLSVSLNVFERLASLVPAEFLLVAESGIHTRDDVEFMAGAGADAILVGESLIVQSDRAQAVRDLACVEKTPRGK